MEQMNNRIQGINLESVPNFRTSADTGRGTGAPWHGGGFSEVRRCIP
jgi:hypothetical protein